MADMNDMVREQAIAWAIRTRDADFVDWDSFTLWLEADPRHNVAYEQALAAEDRLVALSDDVASAAEPKGPPIDQNGQMDAPIPQQPANDDHLLPPRQTNRRRMMFGALAASLVVAVSAGVWTQMPQPYDVMTEPGQREIVALPDGSQITLNGDTSIELDYKKPRYARLNRGEALFTVVHNDDDPFIVDTGKMRLVDAGTDFNVVKSDEALDVAVSEGLVIYNPGRENVSLPAGKRLYRDISRSRVTISDIAIEQVGIWRTGQLSFTRATLGEVAEALDRNLGVTVTASEAIAARPFSGVIQLKDRDPEDMEPIAALLGVRAEKQAKGWILIGDDAVP